MVTPLSVFFGVRPVVPRLRLPPSPLLWTCLGGLAIPLWATWPALSLKTASVPPFECLTLVFAAAWLVLVGLERTGDDAAPERSSWIPALMFAAGESGAAVFFLWATHHIAAAEANLISYLWPGMIVGFGAALGILRARLR